MKTKGLHSWHTVNNEDPLFPPVPIGFSLKPLFCYQKVSSKTRYNPFFSIYFVNFQSVNLVRQAFLRQAFLQAFQWGGRRRHLPLCGVALDQITFVGYEATGVKPGQKVLANWAVCMDRRRISVCSWRRFVIWLGARLEIDNACGRFCRPSFLVRLSLVVSTRTSTISFRLLALFQIAQYGYHC
jgi:hypothetical protein